MNRTEKKKAVEIVAHRLGQPVSHAKTKALGDGISIEFPSLHGFRVDVGYRGGKWLVELDTRWLNAILIESINCDLEREKPAESQP